MSSRNPGTLRVELFWLLDSVSRARHPEFAPLVFEFGDATDGADAFDIARLDDGDAG